MTKNFKTNEHLITLTPGEHMDLLFKSRQQGAKDAEHEIEKWKNKAIELGHKLDDSDCARIDLQNEVERLNAHVAELQEEISRLNVILDTAGAA